MNVQDSERMLDLLSPLGYRETGEAEEADLIILNSCHIREKAAEKIYSDLGRLRKKRRAGSVVAVGGCVGQAEGEEILRRASGNVDMVFGPQNFHKLPMMLRNHRARPNAPLLETALSAAEKFRALAPRRAPSSVSAFLTIQEGCDRFCAFCVVPYTRGAEMSRAVGAIEDEAARLVAMGAKEIVLLGQNVNAYRGRQGAQSLGLGALIKRLSKIPNLLRIRYTTSHPKDMDASLIAAHGEEEKLMPFLHLPVQSGSDRILSLMNRRHGVDFYWDLVKRLRGARKDLALSSDFIVGFPGESEEDFEATLDLARRVRFAQAYSFKYSARPGTPAALAKDPIPEDIKARRLARLRALLDETQYDFNKSFEGRRTQILFTHQGRRAGQMTGRSPYGHAVYVEGGLALKGKVKDVTIARAHAHALQASLGKEAS